MDDQYYDIKTKKVMTVRDRVGGDIVFDHGRMSEQIFNQQLERGVLVRYTPQARTPAHEAHETPFLNAMVMSGLAVGAFGKLFGRNQPPRLNSHVIQANDARMKADMNAQAIGKRRLVTKDFIEQARRFQTHLPPGFHSFFESEIDAYMRTDRGKDFTFRGAKWMSEVQGLYKHLVSRRPEHKDDLTGFFRAFIGDTYLSRFKTKAPKGVVESVLRAGNAFTGDFARRDFAEALTPLVRTRIGILQEMGSSNEEAASALRTYEQIFDSRLRSQELGGEMGRLKAEMDRATQKLAGATDLDKDAAQAALEALNKDMNKVKLLHAQVLKSHRDLTKGESYASMRHSLSTLGENNPRFAQLRGSLEDLDQLVEGMLSFDQEGLRETSAQFKTFSAMASRYVLGDGPDLPNLEAGLVDHNQALAEDIFGDDLIQRVKHTRASIGAYDRSDRGSSEGAEEMDSLQREFSDSLSDRRRLHLEAIQGKHDEAARRLDLVEDGQLHLRSPRPIDRRVVDSKIGQEIIDPQTGERMLVLGSVGDKIQVARMGRASLAEPKGSLGAMAHTSEANAQAIKDTLQQFINRSDDPLERDSLQRLSQVLTDKQAMESELKPFLDKVIAEANLKPLTREEIRDLSPAAKEDYYRSRAWKAASRNSLGSEARDEAMARMFDDIGLNLRGAEAAKSPFGMRDLLHHATDAAGRVIDENIPMGSSLYTVLRQGIPQVAMDQKGVGSARDMLLRILPRSRYKQGSGYSVILSNHPMSHALIETLQKHDVDLKGAVSQDFSKLLGATEGMDDHGIVKQVQAHLGRMFAGRNSRLEKALGSEKTGFDLASDVLTWFHQNQVSSVREISLETPIEGTEDLFLNDRLAAPGQLEKTLYQTYADDLGTLTSERNRLQSEGQIIADLLKNRQAKRARWRNLLKSPAQRMASLTGQIRALDDPLVKMRRELGVLRENLTTQQQRLSDIDEQISNATRGHTERTPKEFLEKADRLRAERERIQASVDPLVAKHKREMAVLTQRLEAAEKHAQRVRGRYEESLSSARNTVQSLTARMEHHEERYANLVERKDAIDMRLMDVNAAIKEGGMPLEDRVAGFNQERKSLESRLRYLLDNDGDDKEIRHLKSLLSQRGLTESERNTLKRQLESAERTIEDLGLFPSDPEAFKLYQKAHEAARMLDGFLRDPQKLVDHIAKNSAREEAYDAVAALLAGGSPMSRDATSRLHKALGENPKYLDAVMTGNVTLRDLAEDTINPEAPKGNRKRVRYLQSVMRGDPYMTQNPHAGYLLESTARAAQKLNEADAVGRAFILDIESAGSSRGNVVHLNGQIMRPVVTEFAVAEASLQDLMGMGRQGFATLRANQALKKTEIFVKPTQQVKDYMLDKVGQQDLHKLEKQQMDFLQKRYAVGSVYEQKNADQVARRSRITDRVGILAISPEDEKALKKTKGLNFFIYEDRKGKTKYAYVQHEAAKDSYVKGRVTEVLEADLVQEKEALHKIAGIQLQGGRSFTMDAQVMSQGQLNNYVRQLNTRIQGKGNVVIANNALLHDLPILISLMNNNLNLQNDALMRSKAMDFLGGAQYFDISTAMRGLGLGSGNVQSAIRKILGTDVEQAHRALEDVLHEAFVGVRLADQLVERKAIHELKVGQHLFDTKTGRMIRVDALQSNQGEVTGISGRALASPWSESMPLSKESFIQDLVTTVDGVDSKQNVEMVRPLMATISDRYRVVDRLDQLTSNQKATAIEKEMQRLMDPRYLERTHAQIAAGSWEAPEFMRPLEGFLQRTGRMGLPSETQSLLLAAAARVETQTVHRIDAEPLKYAAYMSQKLTNTLQHLAPEGRFQELASITMRSAGRELDDAMLTHLRGLADDKLSDFQRDVRAALVNGNMGSELYGLDGGGHFMSAKTVPFKEMLLLENGNERLTPAQLARALNPDDLNQGMLGNAMRELLYGQKNRSMRDVLLEDMSKRMEEDSGGSLVQRQVDGLEMFERYYKRVEDQIYSGLETQLAVDENLKREVIASLKLNDMPTDDAAMREFLRRRASASVRAAHLNQETERIAKTRDETKIKAWSEAIHYERQSRTMTDENAKKLMGLLTSSQRSVMGLPEDLGDEALNALVGQVQAAYGAGIAQATEARPMAVSMNRQSAVAAAMKEALPVGGSLRVSTSDVASPEYREEMKTWARGLTDRDSSAYAELNEHIQKVLGAGADTDRKSAETLEDAVSSMSRDQLDSLYARTHADKAKVFDYNNTFLGYLDKQGLPTAGEGQVHVARVGKSFHAGGFGIDVGLGAGSAMDPAVATALDRSAMGITGNTEVSPIVNAHTAYEYSQGAASSVKGVFATRLEETAAAAEEKAAQRAAAEAVEKSPLLSASSRNFLKIAGGVAAGIGLMGILSKPTFDEGDSSQYLASQELQPPPETFYGHQADAYKDYRKSRSLDLQRAMAREKKEKYERDLQPRRVSNYKVSITADAAAGDYDPAKSEEAVRNVLQQNVSQPLNLDSQRDDQRRSLHDATYQSALRSYLDR